jgi:hypothetical protein
MDAYPYQVTSPGKNIKKRQYFNVIRTTTYLNLLLFQYITVLIDTYYMLIKLMFVFVACITPDMFILRDIMNNKISWLQWTVFTAL